MPSPKQLRAWITGAGFSPDLETVLQSLVNELEALQVEVRGHQEVARTCRVCEALATPPRDCVGCNGTGVER